MLKIHNEEKSEEALLEEVRRQIFKWREASRALSDWEK